MTKEELKEHCLKQIEACEMWAKHKGEEPHGKIYEEHKLILELLEQEPFINKPCVSSGVCEHDKQKVLEKIRAEIEQLPTNYIEIQRPHSVVERDVVELGAVMRILDKYKAESKE